MAFSLPLSRAVTYAVMGLLFITWLIEADFKRKFEQINNSKPLLLLLLFILIQITSLMWTTNMDSGLDDAKDTLYLLTIVILATSIKKEQIQTIITAFLAGMFISEIIAYGVFFELWEFKNATPQTPSPIMNRMEYSTYLAFTSVLFLNRILSKRHTIKHKLFLAFLFFAVTGNLFLATGRTGQVALIAGIVVLSIIHYRLTFKSILVSTLLLTIIFFTAYAFSDNFKERIAMAKGDIHNIQRMDFNSSWGIRVAYWIITSRVVKDKPFGNGLGDYELVVKNEIQSHPINYGLTKWWKEWASRHHPHNQYLLILLQTGFIGLAIYLLILFNIVRLKIPDTDLKELSILFLAVFMTACMAEPLLIKSYGRGLFILFVGLFTAFSIEPKDNIKSVNGAQYADVLPNIRSYFSNSETSIHKARNEIKIHAHKEDELVIKSFKIPNLLNKFIYTFIKSSKAERSYTNSIIITNFVPKPIGYIEFNKHGLLHDSYFVSEKFNFDFTIRKVLKKSDFPDREYLFAEFAYFTFLLHEKNILHLDYSAGNILIKEVDDRHIFKIVDINRMRFKNLSLDERLKNFYMLWAKDEDIKIIAGHYAELMNADKEYCINKAIYYSRRYKKFKNIKKRIKGKPVTD